jgi:hypothetical protein
VAWADEKMKICAIILSCFYVAACAHAATTVPAWQNVVESNATEAVVRDYVSNVIRVEWAGQDNVVSHLMPANLSCQFAVIGDAEVTNRVKAVLQNTIDALNPGLRSELEKYHLINPTLQWLVRSIRGKPEDYLTLKTHPAAFVEADFNEEALIEKAKTLQGSQIPLPVVIAVECDSPIDPIRFPQPGVDCSDTMSETIFSTPFGVGYVIRAPDRFRRIRLVARTFPSNNKNVRYLWKGSNYTEIKPWSYDDYNSLKPELGFAEIRLDLNRFGRRLDVAVFAQMPNGILGPPTIVSFYHSPYAQRKNRADGRLESITYSVESQFALYDLSPIWIPREWTDYYDVDVRGNILSFVRSRPGVYRSDDFASPGEMILSAYSSGAPVTTRRVEYFISPETKRLDYRQVGDERHYNFGEYKRKEGL